MIVAVTGASGHIGSNLVRALLNKKKQVRVLVHQNTEGIAGLNLEKVQGDLSDPYTLYRTFSGVDAVYHLAALPPSPVYDWTKIEAVNVLGTRNVVEACLKCNVHKLVHYSCIQALEPEPLETPVDEFRPLIDTDESPPYERSKALGEREVRQGIEQGLDAVILNPTAVIGPYDYRLSHFGRFILALSRGRIPALVEGGFDWVDARDLAIAAIRAEELAPVGAKYLLSGNWASIQDLAKLITEFTETQAPRLTLPAWVSRTGTPVITAFNQLTRNNPIYSSILMKSISQSNPRISHERATRELDYHPRSLRNTLVDTLRWFRETGMLANPN